MRGDTRTQIPGILLEDGDQIVQRAAQAEEQKKAVSTEYRPCPMNSDRVRGARTIQTQMQDNIKQIPPPNRDSGM